MINEIYLRYIDIEIPFLGVPKWATEGIGKRKILKQEQSKENDVTCDRTFDNPQILFWKVFLSRIIDVPPLNIVN